MVNGVGRLIVLREFNPNVIDLPEEFQDTYNVRLTVLVDINTTLPNTENIEFYIPPRMSVSEQVKGEIELPSDVTLSNCNCRRNHMMTEQRRNRIYTW